MTKIVVDENDPVFEEAKKAYYSRLVGVFYVPTGINEIKRDPPTSRETFRANCLHAVKDLPLPFSCGHLKVAITPKEIEGGGEGVRVCSKRGEICTPSVGKALRPFPEDCILRG